MDPWLSVFALTNLTAAITAHATFPKSFARAVLIGAALTSIALLFVSRPVTGFPMYAPIGLPINFLLALPVCYIVGEVRRFLVKARQIAQGKCRSCGLDLAGRRVGRCPRCGARCDPLPQRRN